VDLIEADLEATRSPRLWPSFSLHALVSLLLPFTGVLATTR